MEFENLKMKSDLKPPPPKFADGQVGVVVGFSAFTNKEEICNLQDAIRFYTEKEKEKLKTKHDWLRFYTIIKVGNIEDLMIGARVAEFPVGTKMIFCVCSGFSKSCNNELGWFAVTCENHLCSSCQSFLRSRSEATYKSEALLSSERATTQRLLISNPEVNYSKDAEITNKPVESRDLLQQTLDDLEKRLKKIKKKSQSLTQTEPGSDPFHNRY
jgi:hypothetical protein